MKKKYIVALVLAATLASQSAWIFAAGNAPSSSSGGNDSVSSSSSSSNKGITSSKSNTTVFVSSTGVKTAGAITSASPTRGAIGVAVDTVATTEQRITTNSKGEVIVDDIAAVFADSAAATIRLPPDVVSAINDINAGKPLDETVWGVDLTDYSAPIGTHVIIIKDAATDAVKTGAIEVSPCVPNLVSSVNNVQILFYDNAISQWQLIPAVKVDPVTKTIAVNIPGFGTLSVVYKD